MRSLAETELFVEFHPAQPHQAALASPSHGISLQAEVPACGYSPGGLSLEPWDQLLKEGQSWVRPQMKPSHFELGGHALPPSTENLAAAPFLPASPYPAPEKAQKQSYSLGRAEPPAAEEAPHTRVFRFML